MLPPNETLNRAGAFIAAGMILILGFVTWALVFAKVPEENQNALTLLIGILSANVGTIIGFFFGSSVTSKKQAETIEKQASTIQDAQAALAPVVAKPDVVVPAGDTVTVKAGEPDGSPKLPPSRRAGPA